MATAYKTLEFARSDRPSPAFVSACVRKIANPADRVSSSLHVGRIVCDLSVGSEGAGEDDWRFALHSEGPTGQLGYVAVSRPAVVSILETVFGGAAQPEIGAPTGRAGEALAGLVASVVAQSVARVFDTAIISADTDCAMADAIDLDVALHFMAGTCAVVKLAIDPEKLAALEHRPVQVDQHWRPAMDRNLGSVRTTVRAVLARPVLSAAELADLKPGAVLAISSADSVALVTGGMRIAQGTATSSEGVTSVTIDKMEQPR